MSTGEEVEARIEAALNSFNTHVLPNGEKMKMDWFEYRRSHYNAEQLRALKNCVELFISGVFTEDAVKGAIKDFRNHSRVGWRDFNIRMIEPTPRDFERMRLLFNLTPGEPTIRMLDEAGRAEFLATKIRKNIDLVMFTRLPITDKLKEQFTAFVVQTHNKSPELLATVHEYESYNPYHKKFTRLEVNIERDKPDVAPALPEETPFVPPATDNASFESRLPERQPLKFTAPKSSLQSNGNHAPAQRLPVVEAPSEPLAPNEIHEEFAAYCEELHTRSLNTNGTNEPNQP